MKKLLIVLALALSTGIFTTSCMDENVGPVVQDDGIHDIPPAPTHP